MPKPEWTLKVHTFALAIPKDTVRFVRTAAPADSDKASASTIGVEARIVRDERSNDASVVLTRLALRAAGAKIPAQRCWLPIDYVDDELEESVDVAVFVRVEQSVVGPDGKLIREVLLDEPLAQINGIRTDEKLGKVLFPDAAGELKEFDCFYAYEAPIEKSRFRSRKFPLPPFVPTLPLPESTSLGSLRVTITVEEHNKLGDYLRKAVEKAKEKRDEVLEKIEKKVNEVADNLKEKKA